MPIYQYRCECGALLEALEKMGALRECCGELCTAPNHGGGQGRVERILSATMIRGDGREAEEPAFDPCQRSKRPGGGCRGDDY